MNTAGEREKCECECECEEAKARVVPYRALKAERLERTWVVVVVEELADWRWWRAMGRAGAGSAVSNSSSCQSVVVWCERMCWTQGPPFLSFLFWSDGAGRCLERTSWQGRVWYLIGCVCQVGWIRE